MNTYNETAPERMTYEIDQAPDLVSESTPSNAMPPQGSNLLDINTHRAPKDTASTPGSLPDERVIVLQDPASKPEEKTAAFNSIFAEYLPKITFFATRISGSRDSGEEIAQDALVSAWKAIDRFECHDGESLRRWIYTIARNRGLNHIRNTKKHNKVGFDLYSGGLPEGFLGFVASGSPQDDVEFAAEGKEEVNETVDNFKNLPITQQQALSLSLSGLTYQEIATEMGKTHDAVKSLIARSRSTLRKMSKKHINVVAGGGIEPPTSGL